MSKVYYKLQQLASTQYLDFASLLSVHQKEMWKIFEAYLDNAKFPDGIEGLPALFEAFKEVSDREYLRQMFQHVVLCFDALHCVSGITRTIIKYEMEQKGFLQVNRNLFYVFKRNYIHQPSFIFFFFLFVHADN